MQMRFAKRNAKENAGNLGSRYINLTDDDL